MSEILPECLGHVAFKNEGSKTKGMKSAYECPKCLKKIKDLILKLKFIEVSE